MRDTVNQLHPVVALAPVVATDNTVLTSAIIDRRSFNSLAFLIALGVLADADATFAVLVEHGNVSNLSDAAAVDDDMLNGTEVLAGFTFAADGGCRKIGYSGDKRYVRVKVTPTGNTGAAPICIIAVLQGGDKVPYSNPPV